MGYSTTEYSLFETQVASLSTTGTNALFRPYTLPERYKDCTINFFKLLTGNSTDNFSEYDIGIAWTLTVKDVMSIENFMRTLHGEKEFMDTFFPLDKYYKYSWSKKV